MRREAADKAEQSERARTFRQRGLRNVGSDGAWASMALGRHGSIVASRLFQRMTARIEGSKKPQFWVLISNAILETY